MARVHKVEKAQKDYPQYNIKKGDTYYWWKFAYGAKQMSLTYPKPSQLTQSAYLSAVYDLQDKLVDASNITSADDMTGFIDEIKDEIQTLLDETQEKLDNMPEQLQSAPTGDLLQERIDTLSAAIDELDGIDTYFDLDESEYDEDAGVSFDEWKEEKETEWCSDKADEIMSISLT